MAAFAFMSPLDTKHHLVDHPSSSTTSVSGSSSLSPVSNGVTSSTSSVFSSFFSKFAAPTTTTSSLINNSNIIINSSSSSSDLDSNVSGGGAVKHLGPSSPTSSPESHCMVKKIKSIFASTNNNSSATVNNNSNNSSNIGSSNQSVLLSSSNSNTTTNSLITTSTTTTTIQSASTSSASSKCSLLKLLSNETSLFNKCGDSSSSLSSSSSCFIDAFELKNKFLNLANQVARDFFIIMLDCRSYSDFNSKRIKDSIHVNCRDKLSKKRLMTRKITVRDLINSSLTCDSLRTRFDLNNNNNIETPSSAASNVLVVDESSSSSEDSLASSSSSSSSTPITDDDNNLIILYDDTTSDITDLQSDSNPLKIVQDNIKYTGPKNGCKILKGGFKQFSEICPEYVEEVLKLNSNQANSKYYEYQADQNQSSIENAQMTRIESFLYLGNESDARNVARLEQEGIYYVLNVTKNIPFYEDLVPASSKSKFVFKRIGVNDSCDQNLRKHFDEAIEFIDEAVRNESKVLVHCQAGVSRSPSIVIAYLMHKYKMRMNDAYARVRDARAIVAPNLIFIGQLMDYESKLFPTSSSTTMTSCASSFTFATAVNNNNTTITSNSSAVTSSVNVVNSTGFNLTLSPCDDQSATITNNTNTKTLTSNDDSEQTAIACN